MRNSAGGAAARRSPGASRAPRGAASDTMLSPVSHSNGACTNCTPPVERGGPGAHEEGAALGRIYLFIFFLAIGCRARMVRVILRAPRKEGAKPRGVTPMSKESAAPRRGLAVAVLIFSLAAPAFARSAPGDLDPSFGTGGKVTARVVTEPQAGVTAHDATAALMVPDGRMLTVGSALTGDPGWSVVMARFLPDGAADPSFGVDGKVLALSAFSFRAFAARSEEHTSELQ